MKINYISILANLLITIFAYMIVPLLIKISNDSNIITREKAKKISLYNSLIVCNIFILLRSVLGHNEFSIGIAPAILYYGINISVLSKGNKYKEDNGYDTDKIQENSYNKKQNKLKGEHSYNRNKSNLPYICIIVVLFIMLCISLYYIIIQNKKTRDSDVFIKEHIVNDLKIQEKNEEEDFSKLYPNKYRVIKLIDTYYNYKVYEKEILNIQNQYRIDLGYTPDETRKAVQKYIDSLYLDQYQKMMLEHIAGGYNINSYSEYIKEYLDSKNLTESEKYYIWEELFN